MRQEAQAIVMAAGSGSRMTSVGFRAKCLLPVGNYPMIYYPLKFLQDSGFEDVTIIINLKDEGEMKKLNEVYGLTLRLDIVPVDTSDDPGTAESLRAIESKLKKNVEEVVIISSDLITDASLLNMMKFHRSRGSALTILTANQNQEFAKAAPPGPKSKTSINDDILCTEYGTQRLVYAVAGGDYDDYINLSSKISSLDNQGICMTTDLLDGHLYIMKRWVVEYLMQKDSPCSVMGSIKAEIIPHLIGEQFSKISNSPSVRGLQNFIKKDTGEDLIVKYNTSTLLSRYQGNSNLDSRVCYAFHHTGFCVRVNTMANLWQINKKILNVYDMLKVSNHKYQKGTEDISDRAQICNQTVIGRSTQIAEKTNIANSILGNHCRIRPFVRISNSVLFDYVQIVEGCVIENSLICVSVERKCVIRNCILTDVSNISENQTYENELLEKGLSQDYSS